MTEQKKTKQIEIKKKKKSGAEQEMKTKRG